ncbi:hypothetical protein [Cellulomonas sp. URHE0023]|uniref:hypothetical protein n=1 Tax=Cellulomonas sp. URHE0023 TaxID=1380354 RepID=UPI000484F3B0|nr:hypothetical protein [Cellulomonas sp. URHE0023]
MTLELREVVSVDIPVPLAAVWPHLREPQLVRRWYRWDHDGLDAEIQALFAVGPVEAHDVVGNETIHTLTWPHHDVIITARSTVSVPGHTRLTVTRRSHQGTSSFDGVRDVVDEEWIAFVHQLAFAITVHPGEDRRTLSTFGLDAGTPGDRLLDNAGIAGIRSVPVGGHVQARRPDGTLLGGTVDYMTPLQFGLRLHGISAIYFVIMEVPAAATPPHGTVNAILSTYGLDDVTFAEVEDRWGRWWSMSMPKAVRTT